MKYFAKIIVLASVIFALGCDPEDSNDTNANAFDIRFSEATGDALSGTRVFVAPRVIEFFDSSYSATTNTITVPVKVTRKGDRGEITATSDDPAIASVKLPKLLAMITR